jgi:hypothetical protein
MINDGSVKLNHSDAYQQKSAWFLNFFLNFFYIY